MNARRAPVGDYIETREDWLKCPDCKESYLHQGKVEVFNRIEDDTHGTHCVVERDEVIVDRDISGNPSSRRQGILISFYCEVCEKVRKLSIVQHKGIALIKWEPGVSDAPASTSGFYWAKE